ncbi:tRNA pseudouridine synthase B [Lophiostoma macrostomum CBS 122681]|uniref:tRNA pseudouridine(55) synthase n=1 Tax=Lophiostoma macrostomum CBS 122681 TaxID=1314788 RepID=A0A6A6T124_9PLEO|nr:tRNA pseudouridine synthase B [Lophiostoma macrostomum CBS 122681]
MTESMTNSKSTEPPSQPPQVLEGIFAISKPPSISSATALHKLQTTFAPTHLFAPLLSSQPTRPSKDPSTPFKLGHGGTLDPLASGILIIGIGRGTKELGNYLACTKEYETVVCFGASTDSYDCTGVVTERAGHEHVTRRLVEEKLGLFRGLISQVPPVYSALKIDGVKACEYVRAGRELPRRLEGREMDVQECTLLDWYEAGQHDFVWPESKSKSESESESEDGGRRQAKGPAVRVRLVVSSGFYVRSFAHDLGVACQSRAFMAELVRTRQANFTLKQDLSTHSAEPEASSELIPAVTYDMLDAGEDVWGPVLRPQLEKWVESNPVAMGHVDGRDASTRNLIASKKEIRPKQRFRGEWVAETKAERIKQQGGRYKGKWNKKEGRPTHSALIGDQT